MPDPKKFNEHVNMEFSTVLSNDDTQIYTDVITLTAIHNYLCLGLAHPQADGIFRVIVEALTLEMWDKLIECEVMSPVEIEWFNKFHKDHVRRDHARPR